MKWSEEALKYKPVTDQDVVHFAPPAKKAMAIERYNRAVRQIEKGNVDMAAISLKSLTAEYPAFVQAAQLNACCQMIWRDTEAAARALTGLLKRSMLTHAEREKTARYLSLIQRTEQNIRQRQQKLPTDHLPHFNMNRATPALLETTGPLHPMAVATKAEVDALLEGRTYSDPDAEPRPPRRVTYGSSLRHSESLSSEKLRAARAAAEQRARARAEAERRRLAREEAKARQRKRLEEQRKRLEAQRREEEKERLAAEAQAKAAAERAVAEQRAKAEAERLAAAKAPAAEAQAAAEGGPPAAGVRAKTDAGGSSDPAAQSIGEAPDVIRPVRLSEASLKAHAAEKAAGESPPADGRADSEIDRTVPAEAAERNGPADRSADGTAAIRPFRISAKPLPAGVRAPKLEPKAAGDPADPAGIGEPAAAPDAGAAGEPIAAPNAAGAVPSSAANAAFGSAGSGPENASDPVPPQTKPASRMHPTEAERLRRFKRHCLVAAIVVLTTVLLVSTAWLIRRRLGAPGSRSETMPAGTALTGGSETVQSSNVRLPELSSVEGIQTTAAASP